MLLRKLLNLGVWPLCGLLLVAFWLEAQVVRDEWRTAIALLTLLALVGGLALARRYSR